MPFNTTPPYVVTTSQNVTASRALNTTYTNNTGKTMWVTISVTCRTPVIGDAAFVTFQTPVATAIALTGFNGGVMAETIFVVSGEVKPGETYRVVPTIIDTGVVNLIYWRESY
jgi:hypothetical protein